MWQCLSRLILLISTLSLCACDPFAEPSSLLDTYTDRLAYVLDVNKSEVTPTNVMLLPRPRDRRIDIEQPEITMLDFLSLYGCELQVVVAERNSILGRVMTPLNQLRYQQQFINKALQCLPSIEDPDLRVSLENAITHKRAVLSAYLWNAIWSDEPMAALLTQSKGLFITTDESQTVTQLSRDLDNLILLSRKINQGELSDDFSAIAVMQQRWLFNPDAGQLLNSARHIISQLTEGSEIIKQRLNDRPLCYLNKPNSHTKQLEGLFFNVYIKRVQPYLAKVSQAGHPVFERLGQLALEQKAVMPETFVGYYQGVLSVEMESSVWKQLDDAILLHTKRWQQLFEQCGLEPGNR